MIGQKKRNAYDFVIFSLYNDWVAVSRKGSQDEIERWEFRANGVIAIMPPYVQREFKKLQADEFSKHHEGLCEALS